MKNKSPLVICNNCDTVMLDHNPSGQIEFEVIKGMPETELVEDKYGWFQGCPICKTDAYLMEITNKEQVKIKTFSSKDGSSVFNKYARY